MTGQVRWKKPADEERREYDSENYEDGRSGRRESELEDDLRDEEGSRIYEEQRPRRRRYIEE